MTTAELITAANDTLSRLGLCLVGVSSKSQSSYWALSRDTDMCRLRLSDHGVVYADSDCAVCVGVSLDDDVRLDLADDVPAAVRRAVSLLVAAEIAAHRESAIDQEQDADDAEQFVRKYWGHLA